MLGDTATYHTSKYFILERTDILYSIEQACKPCIAIDVSKGSSYIMAFVKTNSHFFKKPIKIKHDRYGLNSIKDYYFSLKSKTNIEPTIILEYTGVYHLQLTRFFDNNNLNYQLVEPLQSALNRKSHLDTVKTDIRDCFNLADMFYNQKTSDSKPADYYKSLRILDAEYERIKSDIQVKECELTTVLEVCYPNFHSLFSDILSSNSLTFLSYFPHPDMLTNLSDQDFTLWFSKNCNHSTAYSLKKAKSIESYLDNVYSGCDPNSPYVERLTALVNILKLLLLRQSELKNKLINLAKKDTCFKNIVSIPHIGELSAARIIAGFGDISKFSNPKKLYNFAGFHPYINESGKKDGKHFAISRLGSKKLRCVLFNVIRGMIKKSSFDSDIKRYYYSKKAQPRIPIKIASLQP